MWTECSGCSYECLSENPLTKSEYSNRTKYPEPKQRSERTCQNDLSSYTKNYCPGEPIKYKPCSSGDGEDCTIWKEWGAYSDCDKTCGGGLTIRDRQCICGETCQGRSNEFYRCNTFDCPVWTSWKEWNECSVSCHSGVAADDGRRKRVRDCISHDGSLKDFTKCGSSTDAKDHESCGNVPCPNWLSWRGWDECSATCGGGDQRRTRECYPLGAQCNGSSNDTQSCNTLKCPTWSIWTDWSPCSKSCNKGGPGEHTHTRHCMDNDDNQCVGNPIEKSSCNTDFCKGNPISNLPVRIPPTVNLL